MPRSREQRGDGERASGRVQRARAALAHRALDHVLTARAQRRRRALELVLGVHGEVVRQPRAQRRGRNHLRLCDDGRHRQREHLEREPLDRARHTLPRAAGLPGLHLCARVRRLWRVLRRKVVVARLPVALQPVHARIAIHHLDAVGPGCARDERNAEGAGAWVRTAAGARAAQHRGAGKVDGGKQQLVGVVRVGDPERRSPDPEARRLVARGEARVVGRVEEGVGVGDGVPEAVVRLQEKLPEGVGHHLGVVLEDAGVRHDRHVRRHVQPVRRPPQRHKIRLRRHMQRVAPRHGDSRAHARRTRDRVKDRRRQRPARQIGAAQLCTQPRVLRADLDPRRVAQDHCEVERARIGRDARERGVRSVEEFRGRLARARLDDEDLRGRLVRGTRGDLQQRHALWLVREVEVKRFCEDGTARARHVQHAHACDALVDLRDHGLPIRPHAVVARLRGVELRWRELVAEEARAVCVRQPFELVEPHIVVDGPHAVRFLCAKGRYSDWLDELGQRVPAATELATRLAPLSIEPDTQLVRRE